LVSMQRRTYLVEIHTATGWLIATTAGTKAKALQTLKEVEAEGYDARLWSEVAKPAVSAPAPLDNDGGRS